MKRRIHLALTLSIVAVAGMAPRPASANPGLLHKHGARAIGIPAMLPGQSAPGAAPGSSGAVVIAGGVDGPVAIGTEGLPVGGALVAGGPAVDPGHVPICDMPAPDGRGPGHHGGAAVFHKLPPGAIGGGPVPIDAGGVDSGMVMVEGPPPGFAWGAVDRAGDVPMVRHAAVAPGASGREGAGPGLAHHPMNASMVTAASAATGDAADVAGGGGRTLAAGLPNRAAGVRTDSLATIRHHGHGAASRAAGVAVGGDDASGSVVQAGGVAENATATPSHDRRARSMASAVAGQAAVPPAPTAAPRWRDRLRFAWPTKP